jgi:molybdate transport system substrate-binding protein
MSPRLANTTARNSVPGSPSHARRRAVRALGLAAISFGLAALAGCSRAQRSERTTRAEAPAPSAPPPAHLETKLVVFAATSLRDAFSVMAEVFERRHAGIEVTFNFAGTQELRTQLEQGAAVDVFASADQRHMAELERGGRVTAPKLFARNEPVIVVARESAALIRGLSDLPRADRLVFGAAEVPIGRYTLQILNKAGSRLGPSFRERVEAKVVSRELNVRQVLTKVGLGEAQAGFVYRTDARNAKDVHVVAIPPELNVVAEYPIAILSNAAHPKLASEWLTFVLSSDGQRALREHGFLPPEGAGSEQ